MKRLIFRTDPALTYLVLRLALGVVMFAHGIQKIFGGL